MTTERDEVYDLIRVRLTDGSAVFDESEVRALVKSAKTEAWNKGAEATSEWMCNNPGPSGVPHDPPRNPYEEA